MSLALAIAAAAAVVLGALWLYGQIYTERVTQHWPAQGRFIESHGARLHVLEAGPADAPRVLLIHGASANLRELWHPLADALTRDHRVIAFDRPGYGHSTRVHGAEALALQARMAADVLRATGDGPAYIIAHSLGSAYALRLAHDAPDLVCGLVLAAPATHPYPGPNAWWARLAATPVLGDLFCNALIPLLGPRGGKAGIAKNFAPSAVPTNYYENAGVGLIFRPRAFKASACDVCATKTEFMAQQPLYSEISQPVSIVTADVDNVVSPRIHAQGLVRDLKHADLVAAPGAGHMPHRLATPLLLTALERLRNMASASAAG